MQIILNEQIVETDEVIHSKEVDDAIYLVFKGSIDRVITYTDITKKADDYNLLLNIIKEGNK